MIIKLNQKIESVSLPRRTKHGNFVFDVFMENGDIAVWFNNIPHSSINAGDCITYQLIDKGYFNPILKLHKPKQTLNK